MFDTDLAFWLAVVAFSLAIALVLAGYFYSKHRLRAPCREERYDPEKWTGKAIDVASLQPRLNEVRRNYLATRHSPRGLWFHQVLLEWTRQAVARLAYFHSRKSRDEVT